MANVNLKGITKYYQGIKALENVNLEVKKGEVMCLIGPSGCGKTTLLRIVAGLEQPDAGRVYMDDKDVTSLSPRERDVAMVFQSYALFPHLKARENIGFPLKTRGVKKEEIEARVWETATAVDFGIESMLEWFPRQLSAGHKQRVAVGRATVRIPQVYLLDEPLSQLDAKIRVQRRSEFKKLMSRLRTTTIYVTSDQEEASALGDRIAVMSPAKIEQVGTYFEVYDHPLNLFVAGFVGSPPMNFYSCRFIPEDEILEAEDFSFMVNNGLKRRIGEIKELVIGIRPEDVEISERGIGAFVDLIQPLVWRGFKILYLKIGKNECVAKVDYRLPVEEGEQIRITFNLEKIHLFEKTTGKALA